MEKLEKISDFIKPNETLIIPISFFPDKSCKMTFNVCFEIK